MSNSENPTIILDSKRFIHDMNKLLEDIPDGKDRFDMEFFRLCDVRYYNQSRDWLKNPDLARKNYHHPYKDLSFAVVLALIHL